MRAEQFLKNLDLSDTLLLEADPTVLRKRNSSRMGKLLALGGVAAVAVICLTLGMFSRFLPDPGGDPSVEVLPPAVSVTDTQGGTPSTDPITDTQDDISESDAAPHVHYVGNVYFVGPGQWPDDFLLEDEIPEDFVSLGELVAQENCCYGPSLDPEIPYGYSLEGHPAYVKKDGSEVYVDNGQGKFYQYVIREPEEEKQYLSTEVQVLEWEGQKFYAQLGGRLRSDIPQSATYLGEITIRNWDAETGKLTEETLTGSLYLSKTGNSVYFEFPEGYVVPEGVRYDDPRPARAITFFYKNYYEE